MQYALPWLLPPSLNGILLGQENQRHLRVGD
jgi:hypothetical protein